MGLAWGNVKKWGSDQENLLRPQVPQVQETCAWWPPKMSWRRGPRAGQPTGLLALPRASVLQLRRLKPPVLLRGGSFFISSQTPSSGLRPKLVLHLRVAVRSPVAARTDQARGVLPAQDTFQFKAKVGVRESPTYHGEGSEG